MTKRDRALPKPKRPAHTELRRQPDTAALPPTPSTPAVTPTPLKPRAPAARLPRADDDGLDDLFNDMPV